MSSQEKYSKREIDYVLEIATLSTLKESAAFAAGIFHSKDQREN
jgi:hypothetical protein